MDNRKTQHSKTSSTTSSNSGSGSTMEDLYEAHKQYTQVTEEQWRSELYYESLKSNGVGNIFVKNLAERVDEKLLATTFSTFGEIVKLKVARESNGKSKGYGYVNYHTDVAANDAIKNMDGEYFCGKKLVVKQFVRYKERHPNQPVSVQKTTQSTQSRTK